MTSVQHHKESEAGTAPSAGPALLPLLGDERPMAGRLTVRESMPGAPTRAAVELPGGEIARQRCGSIEIISGGDVGAQAALLEGVGRRSRAAGVRVAPTEVRLGDVAPLLFAPPLGVVVTAGERVAEVAEVAELIERCHHARAVLLERWSVGEVQVCRC